MVSWTNFNVFILLSGWIRLRGVFKTMPALSRFSKALKTNALSFMANKRITTYLLFNQRLLTFADFFVRSIFF